MSFPSRLEYNRSVLQLGSSVTDPKLKLGTVRLRNNGSPLQYGGGFAAVYVVDCGSERYAMKCWTHDIGDARSRYEAVARHLAAVKMPYFVDFAFKADGIHIENKQYPILRMTWVEGAALDDFVGECVKQGNILQIEEAAESFRRMCATLHAQGIAHGDLQGANIKAETRQGRVEITLIDYDTMVVPSLEGTTRSTTGSPHFQHPHIDQAKQVSARDDFFSSLSIYLSLYAVSRYPALWTEFHREEEGSLLFTKDDYDSPSPTPVFRRLHALGGMMSKLAVIFWNFRSCPNLHLLLPLEEAIQLASTPTATSTAATPSGFDQFLLTKRQPQPPGGTAGRPASWTDDADFYRHPWTPDPPAVSHRRTAPSSPFPIPGHQPTPLPPTTPQSSQSSPPPDFASIVHGRKNQKPVAPTTTPQIPYGKPLAGNNNTGAVIFWVIVAIIILIWIIAANR